MGTAKKSRLNVEKRPVQARSKATVAAIVEATTHILTLAGYDALTTNHVAERAGVSIGSLYQYFPSKEALVAEVLDRHCDHVEALIARVFMQSIALGPAELAREVVAAFYDAHAENPPLSRVLSEQLPRLGKLQRLEEITAGIVTMVAAYLEPRAAELRVAEPSRAAFYAVELGEALVMAAILKRPEDTREQVVGEITDIIVRYLFVKRPKAAVRA